MTNKKYEFVEHDGTKAPSYLKQIKALRDIPEISIKAGDLGGFIEAEKNLSHEGSAWVFARAQVSGNAQVSSNARVFDRAQVSGNARVSGNAQVYGNAQVFGNAWVSGNARIRGFDEVNSIGQYTTLLGFSYDVTVTYSSIHIGCQDYTLDELDNGHSQLSPSEVERLKLICEISLDQILENMAKQEEQEETKDD